MNRFFIIFFLILFPLMLLSNSNLGRWEDYLDNDLNKGLKVITIPNSLYCLAALGGIYFISKYDQTWNDFIQNKSSGKFKTFLDISNEFGNIVYTIPVVSLVAGLSLNTPDHKVQDAAFTSLTSILITSGIVSFIKIGTGRGRPEEGKGPYYFKPFSGRISFPSIHAASAFAFLTPWILYYPNILTYSLFIIPVGTGLARMAKKRHWASDVIVGSIIGFGISYLLTEWHKQKYREVRRIEPPINNVIKFNFVIPL